MKKTKKIGVIFVAAIAALTAIMFAACGDWTTELDVTLIENTNRLIVIKANETSGSLEDALKHFQEAGDLYYSGSTSEFGFYLTSINGYEPDPSKNEYWGIYSL